MFFNAQVYSEDSNSEPDVDLENQYYNSKALKEDDPKEALNSFQKVCRLPTVPVPSGLHIIEMISL